MRQWASRHRQSFGYNHLGYYEKTQNKYYKTDKPDKIVYTNPDTQEETTATGTSTDAEIAGNGTYTLKLEGADFRGETAISQLHIATDIPLNDKIDTNVKAKLDGREVTSFDEGVPAGYEKAICTRSIPSYEPLAS